MIAPSARVAISAGADTFKHSIKIKDAAAITGVPIETINHHASLAAAAGLPLIEKRRHRRVLSPHGIYVLWTLRSLRDAGMSLSPSLVRAVLHVTHRHGRPVLPGLGDLMQLGRGLVGLEADLSQLWFESQAAIKDHRHG